MFESFRAPFAVASDTFSFRLAGLLARRVTLATPKSLVISIQRPACPRVVEVLGSSCGVANLASFHGVTLDAWFVVFLWRPGDLSGFVV